MNDLSSSSIVRDVSISKKSDGSTSVLGNQYKSILCLMGIFLGVLTLLSNSMWDNVQPGKTESGPAVARHVDTEEDVALQRDPAKETLSPEVHSQTLDSLREAHMAKASGPAVAHRVETEEAVEHQRDQPKQTLELEAVSRAPERLPDAHKVKDLKNASERHPKEHDSFKLKQEDKEQENATEVATREARIADMIAKVNRAANTELHQRLTEQEQERERRREAAQAMAQERASRLLQEQLRKQQSEKERAAKILQEQMQRERLRKEQEETERLCSLA